jgi:serine/threonine protein phosphatase PrpC
MIAEAYQTLAGPRIRIGQASIAGVKDRNDDSYGVVVPAGPTLLSHGIAMAIADGMSSSEGAKEASESCVKTFLEDYYCTHASWSVKKSAGVVLQSINAWLYAQGQARHGSATGMVSTFSGLILKTGTAHLFHAGDSRISRWRDGRLEPLTRDHRLCGRSQLARAFGADQHLEIDYRAEPLERGDVLVFTTDGVHDALATTDIAALIQRRGDDLDATAAAIVDAALAAGSQDNITCQVVAIDDPGKPDIATHLQSFSALPFPPELAPGMTFDGYAIVRELHTSNRSQVYLARDIASGELLVLKTPSVNFEDDPAYLEMFAREEWVGQLAASPNTLRVMAPTRARRHLYLATEYFDGQTLRQWMGEHPQADLDAVRGIVEQLAKGLRAFHRKDIVHGDLKPENIMINAAGTVKIIDFGACLATGFAEQTPAIERPSLTGTVDYTAPEQQRGERPTNRADIYALGVIAYELLTGRLPYGRGFGSARDVDRLAYIPARQWREDLPVWVDAALQKAVDKRGDKRTDAMSALVEDLRRPNTALGYDRPQSLLERDPNRFWRLVAIGSLLVNGMLALWLARRV